ncbi:MAG: Mth938-like domain-containing protein [Gammaproteobacteria bacterium]
MKLDFESPAGTLSITAYAPGWIRVGDRRIEGPCVVEPNGVRLDLLPPNVEQFGAAEATMLADLGSDIVILGTGAEQRFFDYALVGLLAERGVGLEIMDTGAACRSFNLLAAEGRAVVAALYMI